jgi:hypothetical protein
LVKLDTKASNRSFSSPTIGERRAEPRLGQHDLLESAQDLLKRLDEGRAHRVGQALLLQEGLDGIAALGST